MKFFLKIITLFTVLTVCLVAFFGCENTQNNPTESNETSRNKSLTTSEKSVNSAINSKNDGSVSVETTSQSTSISESVTQPDTSPLNFSQKTDRLIDGAIINDSSFISYYKNLGEYNPNASVVSNAIFVSPNGNGNGTKSSPYSLQDGLDNVTKGQTLYLLGGTYLAPSGDGYYIQTKGDSNNYVTIRNYPGEKAIITNKNTSKESYGFQIAENTCYTVIEGIEIANITAYNSYGIAVWGNNQNHIILRNLHIHDIKTNASNPEKETDSSANAILMSGENASPVSNVIIANCEMNDNVTGWAETLSVAGNCEYIYILDNFVHDITNIGIDFYGNAGYCSTASLDQPRFSIASGNVITKSFCNYADCAGLYVDGARDIILQYNKVYDCQYGLEVGSEEKQTSYPVKNITVRNNIFYNNSVCGMRVGGYEQNATGVVYSTVFANNTLKNNATEIIIAKVDGITYVNNLITTSKGNTIAKTDFNSTYCKNITFTNNYFNVENTPTSEYEFEMFNSYQGSLSDFISKTNATVITGDVTLDNAFKPNSNTVIDKGVTANYGNYDFYLANRVNGEKVDIGAIES